MKSVRAIAILSLILTSCFDTKAQGNLDSLKTAFEVETDVAAKIEIGLEIARKEWNTDHQIQEIYGLKAYELVKSVENDTLQFRVLQALSNYYTRRDSIKAYTFNAKANSVARKMDNQEYLAETYNNLGILHKTYGNFPAAIEAYFSSIEINKRIENIENLADNYQNIAAALELSGKLDKALEYLDLGLQLDSAFVREDQLSRLYNSKAIVHCRKNELSEGVNYFKKALSLIDNSRYFEKSNTLNNLSLAYQLQGKYAEALSYNQQAQDIAVDVNDSTLLIRTMLGSVDILLSDNKDPIALMTIENGMRLADKFKSKKFKVSFLTSKQKIAERTKDYKEALNLQKQITAIKNELSNEEVLQNIDELEKKYETKLKTQQLKETQLALENNKRSKNYLLLFASVLIGTIILFFLTLMSRQRLKSSLQDQEKTLLKQKVIELQKQKEVDTLHALINGQETERIRIARDLHDGIGSLLTSAKIFVQEQLSNDHKASDLLDQAVSEVRRIAHNMMPSSLQKLGLIESIKELVHELNQSSFIEFEFQEVGIYARLSPEKETAVYRIIQEVFTNIIRHSAAHHVFIQISSHQGQFQILIEDDGVGFDVTDPTRTKGVGLSSISSRVNHLRGSLNIQSKSGEGTTMEIFIPK